MATQQSRQLDRKLEATRKLLNEAQRNFAQGYYHTAALSVHKAKRVLIDVEISIERHAEAVTTEA